MATTDLDRHEETRRVPVALPMGAATLIGSEDGGGLTWAARFPDRISAIVALVLRALALEEDEG